MACHVEVAAEDGGSRRGDDIGYAIPDLPEVFFA